MVRCARDVGRCGTGLGVLLALCVALAGTAQGQEGRGPRGPTLFGFNIDLIPAGVDEDASRVSLEVEASYLPQVWLGTERQRLRLVDGALVLPEGVERVLEFFRRPATDDYQSMIHDPIFMRDDSPGGRLFGSWQRRVAHQELVRVARWSRELLRVRCGYSWRLVIDPASRSGLWPVLALRGGWLLADLALAPAGETVHEVAWFLCP